MVDLSGLTFSQLYQLEKDVEREISKRKTDEKHKAIADLQKLANDRGFTLSELLSGEAVTSKRGGKRGPVAAQFCNPGDNTQTWTGRGRKPQWVNDHLATGGTLDDLRV